MSATRVFATRSAALNGATMATRWRTARLWQAQAVQMKHQRATYAIPPQDKKDDDLGGPYGQEHPNPAERKKNNRGFATQTAVGLALAIGFVSIFTVFASPRKIAHHQIENDKQIGSYRSNTGSSLAAVKYKDGAMGGHALHQEQTTSK